MRFEILDFTKDAAKHIERCGRTAHKSSGAITDDSAVEFVRMLIKMKHYSVIEHAWATVKFIGGSRAFTHQLVRHRLMAITQESQRYVDEGGFFEKEYFVVPYSVEEASSKGALIEDCDFGEESRFNERLVSPRVWYCRKMSKINEWYLQLRERLKELKTDGVLSDIAKAEEDARFLLPNAVCSEIVITANLREWRHIFKMRCFPKAQWEIRRVMTDLLIRFNGLFYPVFEDLFKEVQTSTEGEV